MSRSCISRAALGGLVPRCGVISFVMLFGLSSSDIQTHSCIIQNSRMDPDCRTVIRVLYAHIIRSTCVATYFHAKLLPPCMPYHTPHVFPLSITHVAYAESNSTRTGASLSPCYAVNVRIQGILESLLRRQRKDTRRQRVMAHMT